MIILEPQHGDRFVGRWEKIKELKEKIRDNGIVVLKGDRGIGKTNLMVVVDESSKKEGKDSHLINGQLFDEQMNKIFEPSLLSRITGVSIPIAGISWDPNKSFILDRLEKSDEKIISVENAQDLDKKALGLIFEATKRNNKLRFILEIPTPHMKDIKLKPGSYKIVNVEALDYKSTIKVVKNANPKFSDKVVEKIADKSIGYPYIARTLVYICANKNTEEQMLASLDTLRDDARYLLDDIHGQVLEILKDDAQVTIKKLAIAPPILTLKLIEAFCGKGIETTLSDIIGRGILRTEKKLYRIYHPLFRDYLREEKINPGAIEKKKEIYCETMKKIKSEFDSIYMLFETMKDPDIFKELIEISENYGALNSVGAQCYTWGKIDQAILSWSRILKIAKESKNKKWESTAAGNMGNVYRIRGELDKALEYYEKALKLDEELGRKEGMANNYGNMGTVYRIRGELDKALEYYEKAFKLDEELGRKEGMANNYGNVGIVYKTRGEFDKALEYYEKAFKLDEELGRKEGMANNYGNMGTVYQTRGELDKALEYYEKGLKLDEELGIKEGMAILYGNVGIVYGIRGELDKALEYCEKALKLDEELGRKEGMANNYGNMGTVYGIRGELDKALEYCEKALKLDEELGLKEGMANNYGNVGNVYGIRGELDKALEYYGKALRLNEEIGRKEEMANNYGNMGTVYQTRGELDKALEYYEKALKIFKEMGTGIQVAQILMSIGDILVSKNKKERALDNYLEAQELAKQNPPLFKVTNKKVNELLGIK
ncbi:MAG: tetratricopeptide repeat protein [Candidatus Methanoperedens sp.]|nr:tetratricopeptide repeat protein [Candidatus Methanoperedens sp.]